MRPRVVPADTLGQMFAAQKSVLAAASFLSCQKEADASFLSYFFLMGLTSGVRRQPHPT